MGKVDKRRKQVLIIECDSGTLETQNLAVGNEIKERLQTVHPKNGIDLIKDHSKNLFESELNGILQKYRHPCKTVVIIGHSNQSGI